MPKMYDLNKSDYDRATVLHVKAGTWLQIGNLTLLVPCLDPLEIHQLLESGTVRSVVWATSCS